MAADPTNQTNPPPREGIIPDPHASEAAQILGVGAHPDAAREKVPQKWRHFYDRLVEQRDALIDATGDLTQKAREVNPNPLQDEPAEIGTSEYHREELLGIATFDNETLAEVNDAISRIENGTYGICEATGKPIPMERLEAVPWTRFTAEAQEEREARGQATKAALGPLGSLDERGTAPAGPWRDHEGST